MPSQRESQSHMASLRATVMQTTYADYFKLLTLQRSGEVPNIQKKKKAPKTQNKTKKTPVLLNNLLMLT